MRESHEKILTYSITVLSCMILILCAVLFKACSAREKELKKAREVIYEKEAKTSFAVYYDPAKGDTGGDAYEEESMDTVIDTGAPHSKKQMVRLSLSSNHRMPYSVGGDIDLRYIKGFPGVPIDNYSMYDIREGTDSAGYVIWLFRNTLGSCPESFLDLSSLYESSVKIDDISKLDIGDIGRCIDDISGAERYGVCVGYVGQNAVFTHCSPFPVKDYPMGANTLSYLSLQTDSYFLGSPPAGFNTFFRPQVLWEEEEESDD